jgi:hypothetical protein
MLYSTEAPALFPELTNIAYLTGATTPLTEAAGREDLGLLVTPLNSVHKKAGHYGLIGADNGIFGLSKQGRPFVASTWLRWLEALPRDGVLFAALPDVLDWYVDGVRIPADVKAPKGAYCVGRLEDTLELSALYADVVRDLGFPVAIVAQDGLGSLAEVGFEVDAVFVGGSDDYKLGPKAAGLVAEAREAGKWTHVGRVNSFKRLAYCHGIGADSADGTYIRFGPTENFGKVIGWLDRLADVPRPPVAGAGLELALAA